MKATGFDHARYRYGFDYQRVVTCSPRDLGFDFCLGCVVKVIYLDGCKSRNLADDPNRVQRLCRRLVLVGAFGINLPKPTLAKAHLRRVSIPSFIYPEAEKGVFEASCFVDNGLWILSDAGDHRTSCHLSRHDLV